MLHQRLGRHLNEYFIDYKIHSKSTETTNDSIFHTIHGTTHMYEYNKNDYNYEFRQQELEIELKLVAR